MDALTHARYTRRETYWTVFCTLCAVAMISISSASSSVYEAGWITTLLVGILAISWGPMNFWAAVLERRTLLDPRKQFWQFYYGDLVSLPLAIAVFSWLQSQADHPLWQPIWWKLTCIGVSFAAGVTFHLVADAPKVGGYTREQWVSPTKLWHDLFVVPVFLFYLMSKLPVMWVSTSWGYRTWPASIVAVLCVGSWVLLGYIDHKRPKPPLATAHIGFDWAHLRPVKV